VCVQDNVKQHEWKIERLAKDNRALAAANTELRGKMEDLKEENLQVRYIPR
jgi:cell division protein FtsB